MTPRRGALIVAVVAAAAVLVAMMSRPLPPITEAGAVPMNAPVVFTVSRAADEGKPGDLRGTLGQARFHQNPRQSSPSPDRLSFTFDAPALIKGVWISVDSHAWQEWMVGINLPTYGFAARDHLLHISRSGEAVDESVMFGEGFVIEPGDTLDVTAWLFNEETFEVWVSPEVVVYYSWLGDVEPLEASPRPA